jgi:beta-glucanase (GH16 family)
MLADLMESAEQWEPVWNDEFDGSALDLTRWKIYRWKRAADVNKTSYIVENVVVSEGTLKLYVKEEVRGNANYTGGMLESTGPYQRSRYGYFEARIRYNFTGPGFWANFWMTGSDKWPPEFDNEVVTQRNHQNEIFQAHHYLDSAGTHVSSNAFIPLDYREWHVYGVKWLPCQPVEFYLDGQRTFTSAATVDNPPVVDMDVVLRAGAYQTEKWGGLPDSTTQWPGVAEYDWVRVYRWTGKTNACPTP